MNTMAAGGIGGRGRPVMKLLKRVFKNCAKDAEVQPFRVDCFGLGMGLGKWGLGFGKDSFIFKVLATSEYIGFESWNVFWERAQSKTVDLEVMGIECDQGSGCII